MSPLLKDENHEAGGDVVLRGHSRNYKADCASAAPLAQALTSTDKARATLAAMLAIKGYSLHLLADGSFLASKWNCTKHLPSLYAVQGFARQVGAI